MHACNIVGCLIVLIQTPPKADPGFMILKGRNTVDVHPSKMNDLYHVCVLKIVIWFFLSDKKNVFKAVSLFLLYEIKPEILIRKWCLKQLKSSITASCNQVCIVLTLQSWKRAVSLLNYFNIKFLDTIQLIFNFMKWHLSVKRTYVGQILVQELLKYLKNIQVIQSLLV